MARMSPPWPQGTDSVHWIFKNKDHGKTAAAASLGMIALWDVEGGLPQVWAAPAYVYHTFILCVLYYRTRLSNVYTQVRGAAWQCCFNWMGLCSFRTARVRAVFVAFPVVPPNLAGILRVDPFNSHTAYHTVQSLRAEGPLVDLLLVPHRGLASCSDMCSVQPIPDLMAICSLEKACACGFYGHVTCTTHDVCCYSTRMSFLIPPADRQVPVL